MTSDQSHGANRLRQGLPWSLSFRSSMRKKHRMGPPTPSPTCEERIHYPVFNPHDPRHNPAATFPLLIRDYHAFEDSSDWQNTARWMQSLPQRSLRKARSGFLAIRSGVQRRQSHRRNIPGIWMTSDSNGSSGREDSSFPSTISEASTENEHGFGTDLYRTRCNGSSTWDFKILEDFMHENESAHTYVRGAPPTLDISPAGLRLEGETLNGGEGDVPVFDIPKPPPKRPTITWDDANINRVPSRPTTSGSIVSTSTSTSSNVSGFSHVIDPNQALEALYQLDDSTTNRRESVDLEYNADDSVPTPSQDSATSVEPRDSTESNAEQPPAVDIGGESCTPSEELAAALPTENASNITSSALDHASLMEGPEDTSSSTSQDTRSGHSTCYSEEDSSSAPISWSNNLFCQVENDGLLSLAPLNPGDEYSFNTPETSGFHLGRGAEQMVIKDGSIDSGFDVNQSQSNMQHVPELMDPDNSTDDCFLTYTMFQQLYCS